MFDGSQYRLHVCSGNGSPVLPVIDNQARIIFCISVFLSAFYACVSKDSGDFRTFPPLLRPTLRDRVPCKVLMQTFVALPTERMIASPCRDESSLAMGKSRHLICHAIAVYSSHDSTARRGMATTDDQAMVLTHNLSRW